MKLLILLFITCSAGMSLAQTEIILQQPQPVAEPDWIAPDPDSSEILVEPEQQAEFPGGQPALHRFLAENLHYPPMAMENGIQGRCYIQFVVTQEGEITNVKVKKGVPDCSQCDQEAIRVVKKMPKWKPAASNGKPVNCFYLLPVTFTLN